MRKFKNDVRGAVTVMVTLLLIPAILITGIGVDLAAVYAARSAIRNANQMGANSVLTYYDTYLQELYGLYGAVSSDDNLTSMVDAYVRATLLGEDVTDENIRTFQLLLDEDSLCVSVTDLDGLSNVEILRRQIEEYAKWRVPVTLIQELETLSLLSGDVGEQIAADNTAVQEKIALDQQIFNVTTAYVAVYEAALEVEETYNQLEEEIRSTLNERLGNLWTNLNAQTGTKVSYELQLEKISTAAINYVTARMENNSGNIDDDEFLAVENELLEAIEKAYSLVECYNGTLYNISAAAAGGVYGSNWLFDSHSYYKNVEIDGVLDVLDDAADEILEFSNTGFDSLISACQSADTVKEQLISDIAELKAMLETSGCSDELKTNMTEELESTEGTIEKLEDLISIDFAALATDMKNSNQPILIQLSTTLKEINSFGTVAYDVDGYLKPVEGSGMELSTLSQLPQVETLTFRFNGEDYTPDTFEIDSTWESGDFIYDPAELPSIICADISTMTYAQISAIGSYQYNQNLYKNGLVSFDEECMEKLASIVELTTTSSTSDAYDALSAEEKEAADEQEGNMTSLFSSMVDLWEGMTDYSGDPGASSLPTGMTSLASETGPTLDIGVSVKMDGGDMLGTLETIGALVTGSVSVTTVVSSMANEITNTALLVGYGTEMFSDFSTPYVNQDSEGNTTAPVSLTGHEITADSQYFYTSELEYLYAGYSSATANLVAVSATLFTIRFLFNYVASYTIPDVNSMVVSGQTAVAAVPFAGGFLMLLVRPLYVCAETVVDISILRSGGTVEIIKTASNAGWHLSPASLAKTITKEAMEELADEAVDAAATLAKDAVDSVEEQVNTEIDELKDQASDKISDATDSGLPDDSLGIGEALSDSVDDVADEMLDTGADISKEFVSQSGDAIDDGIDELSEEVTDAVKEQAGSLADAISSSASTSSTTDTGLSVKLDYKSYLTMFLFAGDADIIAARIGDLIALNVTMAKEVDDSTSRDDGVTADTLFDLSTVKTAFQVETQVDLNFMFISLPFVDTMLGTEGEVFPDSRTIVESSYRGY